jgi:hypothetical protein
MNMANKENKGGLLSNEQVEHDNKVKGKNNENEGGYRGTQDTGDDKVRDLGNEVKRNDGMDDNNKK